MKRREKGHIISVILRKLIGQRQRVGFSLIELLCVAAILMIVMTLYYGGGSRSHAKTLIASCEKNLEFDFVALKTYATDNDGKLPYLAGAKTSEPVLSQLIPKSTTATGYFLCPSAADRPLADAQPFGGDKISYAYYMGHTAADGADQPLMSDRQVDAKSKTAGQLVFSADGKKPGANHGKYGGNVMFCDGSVRSTPAHAAFDLTNAPNVILLNPNP